MSLRSEDPSEEKPLNFPGNLRENIKVYRAYRSTVRVFFLRSRINVEFKVNSHGAEIFMFYTRIKAARYLENPFTTRGCRTTSDSVSPSLPTAKSAVEDLRILRDTITSLSRFPFLSRFPYAPHARARARVYRNPVARVRLHRDRECIARQIR